ncbi:5728_t:CDS:2 [Diversispora eburnea]|uniref:5728_t:CDS:1 n=1 Tax=Diversispora eburnea TaxID=1213867 RepID=A0A9N9FJT5_9GLOM|nr:5728_t:CDS:2 [Diversispora eburnea]
MLPSLPTETFREIFKYLDIFSLNNCALVNKLWCINSVGLIWQDPFEFLSEEREMISRGPKIINTYISCLSPKSLKNLNIIPSPFKPFNKAFFDYASFLRNLDYLILVSSVKQWLKISLKNYKNLNRKEIETIEVKVIIELCTSFFQHCRLRKLGFLPHGLTYIFADNYLRDTPFIQLCDLPNANICLTPNEILCRIAEISNKLKVLDIRDGFERNEGLKKLFEAQNNLQEFTITTTESLSLISKSLHKKVQNLRTIHIYCHDHIPLSIFGGVTNIQELTLCDDLRFSPVMEVDPITTKQFSSSFTNFTKLKILDLTLKDRNLLQISSLIRKTNGNLQQISLHFGIPIDPQNFTTLIKTIAETCPNLKQLILRIPNDVINRIPFLLASCSALKCVTFIGETEEISKILIEIGKNIPIDLKRLCLNHEKWTYSENSLKKFLDNCEKRLKTKPLIFVRGKNMGKSEVLDSYITKGIVRVVSM